MQQEQNRGTPAPIRSKSKGRAPPAKKRAEDAKRANELLRVLAHMRRV